MMASSFAIVVAKPRGVRGKRRRGTASEGGGHGGAREKPNRTYITLIADAIRFQPMQRATLAEIYDYLRGRDSFFNGEYVGWKNSVRHNLSIGDCFQKLPKGTPNGQYPLAASAGAVKVGKGHHWIVNEHVLAQNTKSHQRRSRTHSGDISLSIEGTPIKENNLATSTAPPLPPPPKKKKCRRRQTIDDGPLNEEIKSENISSPSLPPATTILQYCHQLPADIMPLSQSPAYCYYDNGETLLHKEEHQPSFEYTTTVEGAINCTSDNYSFYPLPSQPIETMSACSNESPPNEWSHLNGHHQSTAPSQEEFISPSPLLLPQSQQYYEPVTSQLVCPQPQVCTDPACVGALNMLQPIYYQQQQGMWLTPNNESGHSFVPFLSPSMYPIPISNVQ